MKRDRGESFATNMYSLNVRFYCIYSKYVMQYLDKRNVYIASKYSIIIYRHINQLYLEIYCVTQSSKSRCAVVLTCAEVDSNQLTRLFVLHLQLQQGLLRVVARVLGQNLQKEDTK